MRDGVPIEVELRAESPRISSVCGVAAEPPPAGRIGLVRRSQAEHEPFRAGEREVPEQVDPVGPFAAARGPVAEGTQPAAQRPEEEESRAPDRAARQREARAYLSRPQERRAELQQRLRPVGDGVELQRHVLVGKFGPGVADAARAGTAVVVAAGMGGAGAIGTGGGLTAIAALLLPDRRRPVQRGSRHRLRSLDPAGGQVHGALAHDEMARDDRLGHLLPGQAVIEADVGNLVHQIHRHHARLDAGGGVVGSGRPRQRFRVDRVRRPLAAQRWNGAPMLAGVHRPAGENRRAGRRTREHQRGRGVGHGQHLLSLSPADHAHEKARLQAEELLVGGQHAVVDEDRVAVADVAVRIEVARLEHHPSGCIGHDHVQPDEAFGVESGRHVVAVGPVPDLDAKGETLLVGPLHDDVAEPVAGPQKLPALLVHFGEQIEVVLDDVSRVVAVVRLRPARRERVAVRHRLLERVGPPAGLVVEGQPLAQPGERLRLRVVRKDAGMNDGMVRTREHVVRPLARPARPVADARRGTGRITRGHARLGPHVAVLAGHPLARRGGVLVLAEGLLQAEAVDEVDVVAGTAHARLRELEEAARFGVHRAAGPFRIRLEVEVAVLDQPPELVVPARTEDRVVHASRHQRQPPADLSVGLVLPVTDDARDPFT